MIKLTALEGSYITLTLSSVLELIHDGALDDIAYLSEEIEESLEILQSSMKEENEDWVEEIERGEENG